ncbi:imidazole glycerol phosphate synthase subunit HisH [Clostridia bacterium]|nr:imidazole glycerol phosphate synthase subunit HisH [Clostridia bacterium]
MAQTKKAAQNKKKNMVAIIDYGAGNIFSVKNALDYLGAENKLTDKSEDIINADKIILPGVGAFPHAMQMLNKNGLADVIKTQAKKKPFMGICLGMQIIFEKGYEFCECDGLGLIPGKVEKIKDMGLVIPHMGWNKLEKINGSNIVKEDNIYTYFVHSYKAVCDEKYIAYYCEYSEKIPALVQKDNIYGCQFHPEKSGEQGLKILENFINL